MPLHVHIYFYYSSLEKRGISTRLSNLFQIPISEKKEFSHVVSKKQPLSQAPENVQWSTEHKQINHECPRWLRNKLVKMYHLLKRSPNHFVGKTIGPFISGNF